MTIVRGQGASGEDTLASDVRAALTGTPKVLGPKHLYDEYGSELYERITTEAPEYYPARSRARDPEPARAGARRRARASWWSWGRGWPPRRARCCTPWPASGALERYVPFDVDESVVVACADELTEAYPGLTVHGVVGDFDSRPRPDPARPAPRVRLPGRHRRQPRARRSATPFLTELAELMGPTDALLLGTDLVKDRGHARGRLRRLRGRDRGVQQATCSR